MKRIDESKCMYPPAWSLQSELVDFKKNDMLPDHGMLKPSPQVYVGS